MDKKIKFSWELLENESLKFPIFRTVVELLIYSVHCILS